MAGAHVNITNQVGLNALENYISMLKEPLQTLAVMPFAGGETIDGTRVDIPEYLQENKDLNLKSMCRKAIRSHLLVLNPQQHLFNRIPQLGLPTTLPKYLLYDVSLDDITSDNVALLN